MKGLRNGAGEGGEMNQEVCLPGEGAQTSACWDLPGGSCTHAASGRRAAQKAYPEAGLLPREPVRLSV